MYLKCCVFKLAPFTIHQFIRSYSELCQKLHFFCPQSSSRFYAPNLPCLNQATDEVKRLRSEQTDQLLAESGASLKIERDNAITKLKQVSHSSGLSRHNV